MSFPLWRLAPLPPARRARRRLRLAARLLRRRVDRALRPLWRFGTWMFLAAGALVGFETIDLLFGGLVLAPELVPVVLLVLAIAWLLRDRARRIVRRVRLGLLRARIRRAGRAGPAR